MVKKFLTCDDEPSWKIKYLSATVEISGVNILFGWYENFTGWFGYSE